MEKKDQQLSEDGKYIISKSSISMGQIGTYKAAVRPIAVVIFSYTLSLYYGKEQKLHPFTSHFPLVQNTEWNFAFCIFYVLFSLVWGPQYMSDKKPLKVKPLTRIYNVLQIISNSYVFYVASSKAWFGEYNWFCEPVAYTDVKNSILVSRVAYYFYLLKLLDFVDTFLFVATKKWENITMLHVVHHGILPIGILFGVKYIPNGQLTFIGFVNSFIHILLYTYYLIATFGPKARPYLWWKKYLTVMQMVQFISIFFHTVAIMIVGCDVNYGYGMIIMSFAVIFLLLFLDFYLSVYVKTKKTSPLPSKDK